MRNGRFGIFIAAAFACTAALVSCIGSSIHAAGAAETKKTAETWPTEETPRSEVPSPAATTPPLMSADPLPRLPRLDPLRGTLHVPNRPLLAVRQDRQARDTRLARLTSESRCLARSMDVLAPLILANAPPTFA